MCGKSSCFHRLSSSEYGFDDFPEKIINGDRSHDQIVPDWIWHEIDDIIADVAVKRQQQQITPDWIWHEVDDIIAVKQQQQQITPDWIWHEIDDIIAVKQQQQPRRKLVRKRKYQDAFVMPTKQLDRDYGLERRKKAKLSDEFAKPKTYQCNYCPADMLSVRVYVHHLKRHREAELRHRMSRCNGCGSLFGDVIQTKWHQTQCLRQKANDRR